MIRPVYEGVKRCFCAVARKPALSRVMNLMYFTENDNGKIYADGKASMMRTMK
jgi:hypothetical protein